MGQESLDIDVIANPEKLIRHAVSFTLEGVQQFANSQLQKFIEETNQLKETILDARKATLQELDNQLEDAYNMMYNNVERLTEELQIEQISSVGYIEEFSEGLLNKLIEK